MTSRLTVPGWLRPRNLPAKSKMDMSWQLDANCRDHPTALFFPDDERGQRLTRREQQAKQICAQCPVMPTCRQYALTAPEPFGIWGATTAQERLRMLADDTAR